jgi:endonuclease/exonuclease/phosphatase (EEP) superfamily protein YafD
LTGVARHALSPRDTKEHPVHHRHPARWGSAAAARILAAVPIVLTALPLWKTGRGWVRIWDFPRVQIAGLGLAAHASMLRWANVSPADRALLAALTGSLLYQASKILPYTPFYRRQVPGAHTVQGSVGDEGTIDSRIRLLMVNVLEDNRRSDLVRQAVQDAAADVVCLVETDEWWDTEMRALDRDYPWAHRHPLGNTYGMILYSRLPIVACETRFLVRPDVPSMRAVVRLRSGDEVVVHALHPRPPRPGSPTYGRDAELVLVAREVARENRPAIVIGDLNDVAWSHTTALFQRLSHMVDPRVGRGMFNTFPAGHPLLRYPLDHVFHTRDFSLVELRRLGYTGSDHFPIVADLAFTPSRTQEMPRPTARGADGANAEDMLEDAAVDHAGSTT